MSGAEEPEEEEEDELLATLELVAREGDAERLDRFLVARLAELQEGKVPRPEDVPGDYRLDPSRALVQRWIEEGRVRIALRPLKSATKVRPGEAVLVDLPPPAPPPGALAPEAIPVPVLHQDDEVLVLDKPAGLAVHPGAGRRTGTLANALLAASAGRLSTLGGPERPGIVHRLDKDTSGAIVIARTDHAHRHLSSQFHRRLVDKEYVALVEGDPAEDEGTIELPLGRHPRDRKRMAVRKDGGRFALTRWRVVERLGAKRARAALVHVKIETGRTHQIRVHMAAIGHPVLADTTYGRRSPLIARQALHAARIAFDHPTSGKRIDVSAPIPDDFARAIEALRASGAAR